MEDLKLTIKPDVLSLLTKVGHFLADEGIPAYLVGGFVRDMLLERDTADIDIAVDGDALDIASRVANALGGKYVLLDELNQIGRVVLPSHITPAKVKWELDFSTLRGNIENDLAQRDFTVNALAIELGRSDLTSLERPMLIDPFNGQADLCRSVIRVVSDTAFNSDAARLLRAGRLAAELGFTIDGKTETLIRRYCHLITSVAGERIREELLRILETPKAGQLLAYLNNLGLLTAIVPELIQAKGVEQPVVHYWDVFDHSLNTVIAVEFLLRQGNWEYASEDVLAAVPWSPALSQHFDQEVSSGSTRKSLLKLAALLHDIAKPQTKVVDEEGRGHFLGHASEGATIATGILERLRFSTREIKLVETMVKHHLRPGQMSNVGLPTDRAIYRYFRDTGEAGIDILFLNLADHLATRGPHLDLAHWREHTRMVKYILTQHFEQLGHVAPPKIIDGHDLINIFGVRPGPGIGKILEAVREAQATGEVNTREQALTYANYLLTHPDKSSLDKQA